VGYHRPRPQILKSKNTHRKLDGCPTFALAYTGFPVDLAGVGELHAAFLNESRTRGCWWRPVQEIRIRGRKRRGEAPPLLFVRAYPEPVVTHPSHAAARRISPATIVALLLALLVTQAASFVCDAQCLQHHQGTRTAAMTHCHPIHQQSNGTAAQTCPPTAASFCVIDLPANRQEKTLAPATIHADTRPTSQLRILNIPARTPVLLRTSIGDPPLITPLRV